MEGTEKPLTRDALVSMQVIDAKGHLVGKVKDVAFAVGKMGISLTVEGQDGEIRNVPWDEIQGASDFIVLKPTAEQQSYQPQQAAAAQPAQQAQPTCPTCGKPLTWIPQYQRWYCYNDKKYA
jgi:sporulation protein YlmC with PRC-barrel domain